ncbi:MAG: hypothetical protein FWF63_10595 [Fibromonadales bacterium]|nr:hypothetical protein [Fibromonadales bacterium]
MKTSIKTSVCAVLAFFAIFGCEHNSNTDESIVFMLNENGFKKEINSSDNGYCPLLPYPFDPREGSFGGGGSMSGSMFIFKSCENREEEEAKANALRDSVTPDGKPYLNAMPDFSYCDNIDKTKSDSLKKTYNAWQEREDSLQRVFDAWQEEVWRVRRDPTRIATVTSLRGHTFINLSPVFVDFILKFAQLEDNQKNDTLFIKSVPDKNGNYIRFTMPTNCPVSLDITLNYIIDENINVVVFEEEQIFQVKRQSSQQPLQ